MKMHSKEGILRSMKISCSLPRHIRKLLVIGYCFLLPISAAFSQPKQAEVIDKISAVLGENIVLKSELEAQYQQFLISGYPTEDNSRCILFEDLLFQKLLLNQAQLDSLEVNDSQVQSELDRRIRYFVTQIGSEKKLEEYYQKSIGEIKDEFHDLIKEQLLVQQMQQKITSNVKITPAEVKAYFNTIPEDSLPYIDSEVQVAQIVKKPPMSEAEKTSVKEKLEGFRQRILKGEGFGTLAVLYSEDPGSAKKSGELGFVSRQELVPEFAAVAFRLKKDEVSEIVETEFGYHILQMIERRGEQVNVRHILLTPKVSPEDLQKAKNYLDSITGLMKEVDTLTFEIAAGKFSDEEETKMNSGLMVNPQTGTTKFESELLGQYDPTLFFAIEKMEVGDISQPIIWQKADGSKAYRLVKLVNRTQPHLANMKEDYQKIQDASLMEKQNRMILKWIDKRIQKTYIKIDEEFKDCIFENNWFKEQTQ